MDRTRLIASLSIAIALLPLADARAGDPLSVFRSEARTPRPDPPSEPKKKNRDDHHHHDPYCDDGDDAGLYLVGGMIVVGAVTSPWWLPPALIGDDYSQPGYFARHPYVETEAGPHYYGYMMTGPSYPTPGYTWAGRASGYYGTDFDSMDTIGGSLLLEHTSRFGIDSTFDFRHQDLGMGMSDELWTGDVNLVYRFAQSENVQMRSGLGVNFLSDTSDTDLGFNFTYGGDFMLCDPLILSADLDLGTLGEASLTHFRTTIGAVWKGVEVYTGYDFYKVGDADTSSMISGVRIWF